jgi:hypothetical protein
VHDGHISSISLDFRPARRRFDVCYAISSDHGAAFLPDEGVGFVLGVTMLLS